MIQTLIKINGGVLDYELFTGEYINVPLFVTFITLSRTQMAENAFLN